MTIPQPLIDSVVTNDCVLFAGSGLSARAGVPTWNECLFHLLDYAVDLSIIDDTYAQSLRAAIEEGGRNEAADGIVQLFENRRDLLRQFLEQEYPPAVQLAAAHGWLQQITFSSVITSNYDRLLEEAFPEYAADGLYTPRDGERLLDALSQKRRFLLKLYGTTEQMDTIIFAPYEYRQMIASNISFGRFMEGMFFSKSFLFLGLSLDGIQDFLSGFVFRGVSPRRHYALVPTTGTGWKVKADLLLRRYNIEVISFPFSSTMPEVDAFLHSLSLAVRPVHNVSPVKAAGKGIRKLILEDIGAYERLELDFPADRKWKILLGDNGVGKSTILKAIAVAIMGSDARSYAGRLVRLGKTKGVIRLFTEQNPHSGYITEILTKDMGSEAEVVSLPARPLEAEGWLALAFSPLRVVSWSALQGPQTMVEKGRATSEDLLPLISGEVDARMDRLKQWIVNLDAADQPGRAVTLTGHTRTVSCVLFTPDGKTVISSSFDGTIRYWDAGSGAETKKIAAHEAGINWIALNPTGELLISGSFDRFANVWNTADGSKNRSLKGHQSQVYSVALQSDGGQYFTGTEGGSIRFFRKSNQVHRQHANLSGVVCMAISPTDRMLASGHSDGMVRVHDTVTGELWSELSNGNGVVRGVGWLPYGNDRSLVVGSSGGAVRLWNMATRSLVREYCDGLEVNCVAVSPDGKHLAAGFQNGELRIWEVESGQLVSLISAHKECVWSVTFSPDCRRIATSSEDKTVRIWNLPQDQHSGQQQETIRRFFQLLGKITERTDIDFLHVTPSYRVMVRVADAPDGVPLEALSQGMTSLFGWIGVLCQRLREMREAGNKDPLPTNAYALVLIDELDAHMHPRWQQVLVHRLKEVFPEVQFIVSTHSPLIAAGLDETEVERFKLEGNKVVKTDFDGDMTLGRADQILTGELFGLSSTLDVPTQKFMKEYEELLSQAQPDQDRLRELERLLEDRIPPVAEKPLERRARELVEVLQPLHLSPEVAQRLTKLSKVLRGESE